MHLFSIITDNGGGDNAVWHDVAGEEYTFPTKYLKLLPEGTYVVYHRSAKGPDSPMIADRMSDGSHYFGVAIIGKISQSPDGNYRAEIKDFKKFKYPVDIHRPEGGYYEVNPFFQQGVRKSSKDIYDDIVAASIIPPTPVAPKAVKRKGIKSQSSLYTPQRSKPFYDNKYEIVTSSSGYYIYNVADQLYYELEKPKPFNARKPDLKVLRSPNGSYLITHDGKSVGFIDPITNGVLYKSLINNKSGIITVNM